MISGSFSKNLDILQRTLNVTSLRQSVISNNFSNAETPNFKRSYVTFESQLQKALASETHKLPFKAKTSNEKHFQFESVMDYKKVSPNIMTDYLSQTNNNGNNVSPEEESAMLTKNRLQYLAISEVIKHEFNQIQLVTGR